MKKYILVLLLGLIYIGVFGETKEEADAFEAIKIFLKDKGNYNLTKNKVAIANGFDFKKGIYFFSGNDINLTNQKQRCIKSDSTKKCIQFADNILIPIIEINKAKLLDYPNKLKDVKYENNPLFKEDKLKELSTTLKDIFKTQNDTGIAEPTIKDLKTEIDRLTNENKKLKEENEQLKKGINPDKYPWYLLYPLIGVSGLVLVLLFLLFRAKQKRTKDLNVQDSNLSKENEYSEKIKELTEKLSSAEREKASLQKSVEDLNQKLTTAKTTIANLITKIESKQTEQELNNQKKQQENTAQKQERIVFPKTFYAQSPGDKYFTNIKYKYQRGNTPYVLQVNEEETEGEFYLYQSVDNYEDALMRHDSVLLYACEIPPNGIDKKTYSKVETPENGKGKIKKVGDKWEIVQKAKIKLS